MLFNSYLYIFFFIPIVAIIYFSLIKTKYPLAGKVWLVIASLFFYGSGDIFYVPLLLFSVFVNYKMGTALSNTRHEHEKSLISRKAVLTSGIIFNLGLLLYYKYINFFIDNSNALFGSRIPHIDLVLPLAISFFTFQQIAFLVDTYKRETTENDFLNYCLFVTFFPRLIAGPIVYHKEIMTQFGKPHTKVFSYKNLSYGIFLFFVGLFKKVIIADSFSGYVTNGFDVAGSLNFFEAWIASLSYTLQIYFDFSGYTDMAIGSAYVFNIKLPQNFNSPYKALDIQDFWRRWHITLSRWLVKYLYIPLGGSRRGSIRTVVNIFITFLLCGIWHGAGWTFVVWGALHGLGIVVYRIWRNMGVALPRAVAWVITFLYVNWAWVFFRARDFSDAIKVFKGMFGLEGIVFPRALENTFYVLRDWGVSFGPWLKMIRGNDFSFLYVVMGIVICIACKNSMEIKERISLNPYYWAIALSLMAGISLIWLDRESSFLYFQF